MLNAIIVSLLWNLYVYNVAIFPGDKLKTIEAIRLADSHFVRWLSGKTISKMNKIEICEWFHYIFF